MSAYLVVEGVQKFFTTGPVVKHKVYYKGEGGGFPPSLGRGESCESKFAHGSS